MTIAGTLYEALQFRGRWTIFNNSTLPLSIGGYDFPIEPQIAIRGRKNIIITDVNGGIGSVKEFTGLRDYIITVSAILQASDELQFWYQQFSDFISLWSKDEALEIVNKKTSALEIYSVVVKSFDMPPLVAATTQRFTLNLLSDVEVDLDQELAYADAAHVRGAMGGTL